MAELGQQTVPFSTLVSRAADESFLSLKELVEKCRSSEMSDSEKKIHLLKYIFKTKQRILRLNVLAKWCLQVPLIQYCQQLASTLSSHDTCFAQAADSLFFMHEGLPQARAPIYDVPSAIEVLLTGSYERLPKCVEDVGMQSSLNESQQKPALKKLDILLRSRLLEISLPKEISEIQVSNGTALMRVDGEFKVLVTLGYRGHVSLWRILHLELLVGERSGPVKLEELRRLALGDDLERRMAASESPFSVLYSVLHELCVALIMDTVIRQVQALRQGRWKDAIRFELISDGGGATSLQISQDGEVETAGHRIPGVKVMYWLDLDKNTSSTDTGPCPFIKIEPGSDLQINCVHSTFVIDPTTGKEAEFCLDHNCIDVEKLLLKAINCNIYTRLLEIHKELLKNGQLCQAAGDVVLECQPDETDITCNKKDTNCAVEESGQEVLRVRAYGLLYFILGINIRSGRYLLQSSGNVIAPSALSDSEDALNHGTLSASEVFITLRSKSILHLFASVGRFLGLEVYEHGFSAVKVPKNILSGSSSFLMGFPDFSSCYFLLTELDRDFKPVFKLLETEPDQSGKSVTRFNKIDVSQMQMLEDEMNLSILDWKKLVTFLSRGGGPNLPSEHGLSSNFSLDRSMPVVVCSPSSFSSVVDEVFELEKGTSAHSVPAFSSSLSTSASYFGSLPLDLQNVQANSTTKFPGHYNNSLYPGTNFKGLSQATSVGSLSSATVRSNSVEKLSVSKSDQDLTSLRSPQSVEARSFRAMDEDHLKLLSNSSREIVSGTRSSRPAPRPSGPRASENLLNDVFSRSVKVPASSSWATTPVSQAQDLAACMNTSYDAIVKQDKNSRKRTVTDMLNLLPSLLHLGDHRELRKRRKLSESPQRPSSLAIASSDATRKERCSYGDLIAEANKGNAPSSIYFSALLHVVRHCSLCIKHAQLTSQMEELDIPYVEEVGLRNTYSNIWFGLSSAGGNSWHHICLRLGKPGSMYWDVKINDQHFRDLWELQKGSNAAPWGFGVRIANTSDVDSHIRYDSEGVVLSYPTVEADSIRKLVADIRRLSNARMFALGMRKLLGVRTEEKPDEVGVNSDGKTVAGGKGIVDGVDKLSEQMRRAFRIEAVGLTSVWFSFGSGVLARFVVEWESGKEGCTMHVSPDQLWPHTKFLEDFINGGEVTSLLDCIRLTAGPLHALAAATRPARAGQPPTSHGVSAPAPSISKQTLYASSPGLLPGASITSMTNLANHGLPGPTMLGAGARSGSGIVPSSLLPIDVSVVLRGPYWIRIIYRKDFAVDMRCFAGDQVWLQPATPPKGGPSIGGSLPCPQFRPFIMEHVAQELNGLEPNFTTVASSNNPTSNSSAPVASSNGNRVNLLGNSTGLSRTVNQVAAMNRQSNSLSTPSSLAGVGSGMGLRRSPGTGVPAHVRGEFNTAIIGLGDDGGYGGGWVPPVALKKVLRGILKYLGVLWLFAQLPDLLKEILGSILKENEGALLNLDQEQPALRFFVGGYVFAVSVHRVQLLLQVLSVKRFHQQQQQQQQNLASAQEELTQSEIGEICDYFSRRVASEPYDASRVASFITLLTLPISVLREFLKLITWKKGISQAQGGDVAPAQKPRIELCLENHAGLNMDGSSGNYSAAKSNVHYDRAHNAVDFALTVVLDPAHIPHISAAGGAAWLPYCASVRLRYSFGENPSVMFLGMEGSHGGRACWLRLEDWEKSKQRVARTVEVHGSSPVDINQGRLRLVADHVQRTLHLCLQGLRDGGGVTGSTGLT